TYAPDQFARLCRRQEERRVHVPKPRGVATGSQRWDVDDGLDDPCDQIPILGDMDWNHRLDVEEINHVIMLWACGEVVVILERHTDQISHRVLRLLTSSASLSSSLLGSCGSAACADSAVSRKRMLNTPKTPSVRTAFTCPPWRTFA